jgi:hypothetical protein
MCTYNVSDTSVGSVFAYSAGGWGSILNEVIFLITMAFEAVKFHLIFNSWNLFIFFLPLLTVKNERSAVGFSM